MKVLVINAGSSSFKYQLIDMTNESVIAKGLCERIGTAGNIKHKAADGRTYEADYPMPTHMEAFDCLIHALTKSEAKVLDSLDEITAVGHRVVQGGDDHHGLSHRDDQRGEPLGGYGVNDPLLAADKAADHEQKEGQNDGEKCGKAHASYPSFPSSSFCLMRFMSSSISSFLRGSRRRAAGW